MEGLADGFFIILVIVVMIVQTVAAQKKKQRKEAERSRTPGRSGLPEMTGSASAEDSDEPVDIFTKLARAGAEREAQGPAAEEEDSSEDLIPKEIWQEIAELAVGRRTPEPPPKPAPAPELPQTRERAQLDEAKPDSWEGGRMREVSPGTPGAGKSLVPDRSRKLTGRMEEAATSATASVGMPAPDIQLEVVESEKGAGRMEWLFGGKSPEDLRKAILVREVLGPPLALREEEEF